MMGGNPKLLPLLTAALLCVLSPPWAAASVCESRGDNFGGDSIYILPPPKSLTRTNYSLQCTENAAGTLYNNDLYADGSGPRGAHNASECCALCAANDACSLCAPIALRLSSTHFPRWLAGALRQYHSTLATLHPFLTSHIAERRWLCSTLTFACCLSRSWSYNVDPSLPNVPPGTCRWGALTWCCFFHSSSTNLTTLKPTEPSNQFGAKGQWSSGTIAPTTASTNDDSHGVGAAAAAGPVKTELVITASTGVFATDPSLLPLAGLIAEDIFLISGIQLNATTTAVGKPAIGDISFSLLKPTQRGLSRRDAADADDIAGAAAAPLAHTDPDAEKYTITIDGRGVAVGCYAYTGCAWGVTTLLQTLCVSGVPFQTAAFPTYNVTDGPVRNTSRFIAAAAAIVLALTHPLALQNAFSNITALVVNAVL